MSHEDRLLCDKEEFIWATRLPFFFFYSLIPFFFLFILLFTPPHLLWRLFMTIMFRPKDDRNKTYAATVKAGLLRVLTSPQPQCVKLVGYFQSSDLCLEALKRLWRPSLLAAYPSRLTFHPQDISIYFRCSSHYHAHSFQHLTRILAHTSYHHVYLFASPTCPSIKSMRDEAVMKKFLLKVNATVWKSDDKSDASVSFLHDFVGLMTSPRLILPSSTWAMWAGFLGDATEIHVDPTHHRLMGSKAPQYIYHSEKLNLYYGTMAQSSGNQIEYAYRYDNSTSDDCSVLRNRSTDALSTSSGYR